MAAAHPHPASPGGGGGQGLTPPPRRPLHPPAAHLPEPGPDPPSRARVDAERAGGTARVARTMDGFYDQQVPFMGPGVSLPTLIPVDAFLPELRGTPYPPPGEPLLSLRAPPASWAAVTLSLQKSCTEEGRGRPGADRKRKFLETDLAHDSEGRQGWPGQPHGPVRPLALHLLF